MRKVIAGLLCSSAALFFCAGQSAAQTPSYPARNVRLVVPFGVGGSIDAVARVTAAKVYENWGQALVVDNRTGADGDIGAEVVARSAPDGYTLLLTGPSLAVNVSLRPKRPYQIDDFAPIMLMAETQSVLCVYAGFEAKSVKDVIDLARARPGTIDYGSAGVGSSGHLATELFRSSAGIDIVHVPFRNSGLWQSEIIAGRIPISIPTFPAAMTLMRSGKVRCLAVTGAKRSATLPDLPTIAEAALPGYVATSWYALLAPRGTSGAIIERIHRAFRAALEDPVTKKRLTEMGVDPVVSTPAVLANHIRAEVARWAVVVKQAKIATE
ncbi:MAG: tripartite tricarboxylate transporter substrate binding protein [Betaproteobacteria bacterium]|nr:tripartite tricarboxylate transporter substrate binding protein [Betaproteobacteria bacterium]